MLANAGPSQGSPPPPPLPGNLSLECNEAFPQFCLHEHTPSHTSTRLSLALSSSSTETSSTVSSSPTTDYAPTLASEGDSSARLRTYSAGSPPAPRSRRDKTELLAARVQRSASNSLSFGTPRESNSPTPNPKPKRFQRTGSNPAQALAAVEPPHEQGLTRMAFAEQQRWITVQQKTFTKWYGHTTSQYQIAPGLAVSLTRQCLPPGSILS
jgi:hypothetical protein